MKRKIIMLLTVVSLAIASGKPDAATTSPKEITAAAPEIQLVSVPGGCFTHKEGQEFCVSDFRIGKFEVTQAQWESVMENNPSYYLSCGDDCPVERVSWDDAQEFINILNAKSGKSYRLPTEAEWEYACRSVGRNEEYCGGNNYDAVAWQGGNSVDTTHKVGTRKPNGLGIYDMSGNVWEWCSDWYGLFSNGKLQDYKGPASGKFRVIRGGSWDFISDYASSTYRSWNTPDSRSYSTGFRLVLPAANNTKAKQ